MPGPGAYLIGQEEKEQVLEVLNSGYFSRYGDPENANFRQKVYTLEQEFCEYVGAKHCIATTSGTASLYISMQAAGIGPGDEVIVPGYTFIASYSSIIFTGATPVLAEIDESLTLDPDDVEKKITAKTKAIMPVHMIGNPSDMDKLGEIADKHKLIIIEDACQAMGGSYHGGLCFAQ